MSHVDAGPLAGYNSLLDPHLAGFFSNSKMKRHLVKSGLVTKKGHIISENTYRLNMARKEHKKHVRDLLAQAIVHKTLDTERTRQVAIKQKLEEIAKIELVRRIRNERNRKRDDDLLPYLDPSGKKSRSRPQSGQSSSSRSRPKSAPSKSSNRRHHSNEREPFTVDDDGIPQSRPRSGRSDDSDIPRRRKPKSRAQSAKGRIDDKHLYSLNQQALQDYTMGQYNMDSYRGSSPYTVPQYSSDMVPAPPASGTPRSSRARPRTARRGNQTSPDTSPDNTNRGSLMLHRPEPAMKHQERVQTMCDVSMHYFGPTLRLDYERFDPRDEIIVEQQHCGGNTLQVFREHILPGTDFTFTSRRHRGYPFSLTFYMNGIQYCRLSTCCEYKHPSGSRLGGSKGYFSMLGIEGAAPCYKCQVNSNKSKSSKKKRSSKKDDKESSRSEDQSEDEDNEEEVQGSGDEADRTMKRDPGVEVPVEEDDCEDNDGYSNESFDKEDSSSSESDSDTSRSSHSSLSSAKSTSSRENNKGWTEGNSDEEDRETRQGSDKEDLDQQSDKEDGDRLQGSDKEHNDIKQGSDREESKVDSEESREATPHDSIRGDMDRASIKSTDSHKVSQAPPEQDGDNTSTERSQEQPQHVQQKSDEEEKDYGDDFETKSASSRSSRPSSRTSSRSSSRTSTRASSTESNPASTRPYSPQNTGNKWIVRIHSSDIDKAGTDANVYFMAFGKKDGIDVKSDRITLDNSGNNFERDMWDDFEVELADVGDIYKIVVGHDASGALPGWHLDKVELSNKSSGASYTFPCGRWLAEDEDDGAIVRELLAEGSDVQTQDSYKVQVYTGDKWGAGTNSNVYINLIGTNSETGNRPLNKSNNNKDKFERGQMDEFTMETIGLGDISKLVIGHDGKSAGSGWYLDKVVIAANSSPNKSTIFYCDRWLDTDEDDHNIELELVPSQDHQKDSEVGVSSNKAPDITTEDSSNIRAIDVKKSSVDEHDETPGKSGNKRRSRKKRRNAKRASSSSTSSSSSSSSSSTSSSSTNSTNSVHKIKQSPRVSQQTPSTSTVSRLTVPSPHQPSSTTKGSSPPGTKSIRPLLKDTHDIELEGIKLTKQQVVELCEVIVERPGLEALTLRSTGLDDQDLEKIAQALSNPARDHDRLSMLNLNSNNLSAASAHHLLTILDNNPKLELLLVHDCGLGDVGVHTLVQAFLRSDGDTAGDADIQQVARHLVSGVLEQAVAAAGTESTNDEETNGSESSRTSEDMRNLMQKYEKQQQVSIGRRLALEHLDLGDCDISDRGVDDLAQLMSGQTLIDTLCLTGNRKVTARGWAVLGAALKNNNTLTTLMLDYNTLADEGIVALAKGLCGNNILSSLDLEGNKIGDVGAEWILRLVKECKSLADVTLMPGNHISQHLLNEINSVLSERE